MGSQPQARIHRIPAAAVLCLLISVAGGAGQPAAVPPWQESNPGQARLIFTKKFPGSKPEFIHVVVAESGETIYRGGTISRPEEPEEFQLSAETTRKLFDLAAALDHFRGQQFDARRNVARMGEKTLAYEKGNRREEVSYNYTENEQVRELQSLFESIARSREFIWELGYRPRFDRLGVADTLRRFDQSLSSGELVDVEAFVPPLEQIQRDLRLMTLARNHASRLLARIQTDTARVQLEFGDTANNRYISVVLDENGVGTFVARRLDQRGDPRAVKVPPALNQRLWELVRLAENFRGLPSAPPLAGALTGYRLSYEKGIEKNVTAVTSPAGVLAEVVNIFDRVLQQQSYLDRLRAAMEKDPFTLQAMLQELERAIRNNALADPEEFVPLLESQLRKNGRHPMERDLVTRILEEIRAGA